MTPKYISLIYQKILDIKIIDNWYILTNILNLFVINILKRIISENGIILFNLTKIWFFSKNLKTSKKVESYFERVYEFKTS